MKNKKEKNNSDKPSNKPSKKHKDQNPDKKQPHPDDPNEQTGPPVKEMPKKSSPHQEEILDRRFVTSKKMKPTNLMRTSMDQYHRSLKMT